MTQSFSRLGPGTAAAAATAPEPPAPAFLPMSEREVSLSMIALTMSLFVAMLSNLVVLTALPRIVADLRGSQAAYTWIVTASMLTIAVCTPVWGRMSDMVNKKLMIQLSVAGYVLFSVCAGMAPAAWVIIVCRVGIGVSAAGIIVMMQSISADIMAARNRARWIGYRSVAMSVGTVIAPSLGGFITEHFGWRCCFFVGVPFAVASIVMVQRTLRLPAPRGGNLSGIDLPGAILLAAGIVTLMLWVSVVGPDHGRASAFGIMVLLGGALLLGLAIAIELRARAPMLPLELFRQREVLLCVLAGIGTGAGFFGSAVFLAPYLQLGRGLNPSLAGLMALPEAGGAMISALIASRIIARQGRYKNTLIVGALFIVAGFGLLSTLGSATPFIYVGAYVALVGGGLGIVSENLVLVVQNTVKQNRVGSVGALVVFFRMLGGVFSVAILGALLSAHVAAEIGAHGVPGYDPRTVPELAILIEPLRTIVQAAYAHGVAAIYLVCVPPALLVLVSVCLLRERRLATEIPSE
jgi:MFS family permease